MRNILCILLSTSPRSSWRVEQRQEGRWWFPSWQTWQRWTRSNRTQTGHRSQSVPTYSIQCTIVGIKIDQNVLKSPWLLNDIAHDFESSVLLTADNKTVSLDDTPLHRRVPGYTNVLCTHAAQAYLLHPQCYHHPVWWSIHELNLRISSCDGGDYPHFWELTCSSVWSSADSISE